MPHAVRWLHNIPLYDFTIILLNPFPTNGHFISFPCFAGINKSAINVLIYLFYKLVNSSQNFVLKIIPAKNKTQKATVLNTLSSWVSCEPLFLQVTGLRMSLKWVGSQGPWKEAQAKGRFPGVQEGEKQPSAVVPSLEGVFIKAVGEELARLGGVQCWLGEGPRDWSHSAMF